MRRVLLSSHTGRSTGFGTVVAGIASALTSRFEVHVVGLGCAEKGESWIGHCHDDRFDPTRTSALARLAEELTPDVVIAIGQAETVAWMVTRLRRNAIECPIVAYVPVEGAIRGGERLTGLSGATEVVAYTPQAADALREVIDTTVTSIPHAISPVDPISAGRRQLRESILPLCRSRSEGTWILNANRNDARKRPEVTLAAFAEIASLIPSATLLMHCAIRRRGVDLAIERDRLDLRDSVIFTHDHASAPWHVQRLHDLYASCEIGVSSSTGEGWGLIAAEHAQYRAAQIMPAHPGLREIWGSSPQWISPGRPVAIDWVFDGGEPEPRDLAAAMLKLLKNPERAAQIGRACEIVAKQVQYSWQSIGPRWIDLVENLAWGKTNQR